MQSSQLYYEDTHKDRTDFSLTLLYVHGNLITSKYWEPLVKQVQLIDPDLRQVRIDMRGFGRSQPKLELNSIMDLAIDVKGFIQNVLQIPESDLPKKLVLVGWSLGCLVTMQLAAQWPELFRRMIFLSSGPITGVPVMEDDDYVTRCTSKLEVASTKRVSALNKLVSDQNVSVIKQIFLQLLFNSGKVPTDDEFDTYLQDTLMQTNYVDVVWAIHDFDISAGKLNTAQNIKGPILIIHGKIDAVIAPIHAEGIVHEIGPEKCKLLIRNDLGHMIPIEDPKFTAQEMVNFLKE